MFTIFVELGVASLIACVAAMGVYNMFAEYEDRKDDDR